MLPLLFSDRRPRVQRARSRSRGCHRTTPRHIRPGSPRPSGMPAKSAQLPRFSHQPPLSTLSYLPLERPAVTPRKRRLQPPIMLKLASRRGTEVHVHYKSDRPLPAQLEPSNGARPPRHHRQTYAPALRRRRRYPAPRQGAEILLPIESITEANALGGKMLSRNARALISGDLHPLPVFARGPGAVELAAGASWGREQDLLRRRRGGKHRRDRRPQLAANSARLVDEQH